MADWRTRPVSTNIQDYRNGVPLIDQIIEGYKYSGAADFLGDSYAAQMARAPSTPMQLVGGPGPYRGDPLISIEDVRGRQVKPGMTLEQAKAAPLRAPPSSFDQMYRDSGGSAFNFVSQQPKSSGKMAEWWQSPAYDARAAAGLVQTPGLIDMGGIYDAIQAPYWQRQDREQGNAVADPISLYARSNYVAQPRFASQSTAQDPISIYAKSNYTAQPRFASAPSVQSLPNQPSGSVRVAKDSSRLPGDPNPYNGLAFGYDAQPTAPVNPAVRAIDAAAPTGPMFPLQMPRATGTPYKGNYTASMRFASPNAGKGSDIIDLTASNPSDRGAQGIADSQGAPVRVGQKVYYPGGKAPVGAPQARNAAPAQQQRSGGLGGLLGSLFGGGNLGGNSPVSITVPGSSSIGASPSQGKAMTVNPGTSSGSVLSGMGFSDGALVPAATVRNLESRGYFK